MSTYLYGVVRWPAPKPTVRLLETLAGVGEPSRPVELYRHRSTAALVSRLQSEAEIAGQSPRNLRRDMKAHAAVLNRLAAESTVLPFRFGIVFPDEQSLVERVL